MKDFRMKPKIVWRPDRQIWMCFTAPPLHGAFGKTPRDAYQGWYLTRFGKIVAA